MVRVMNSNHTYTGQGETVLLRKEAQSELAAAEPRGGLFGPDAT
jgi:hypothetical protein